MYDTHAVTLVAGIGGPTAELVGLVARGLPLQELARVVAQLGCDRSRIRISNHTYIRTRAGLAVIRGNCWLPEHASVHSTNKFQTHQSCLKALAAREWMGTHSLVLNKCRTQVVPAVAIAAQATKHGHWQTDLYPRTRRYSACIPSLRLQMSVPRAFAAHFTRVHGPVGLQKANFA